MVQNRNRQQQAKVLRIFRKIHRTTGAFLFLFFLFISITGLLLGWKKHSNGIILAETEQGTSTMVSQWLPLNTLTIIAIQIFRDSINPDKEVKIDRIDVRPEKGVLKFKFKDHYHGLQLDAATGKLLKIEKRRSDFIEQVHDGSILDLYFGTSNGQIKLFYTTIMGLALLIFTVTGFWLWYGPKRMKRTLRRS